MGRQPRLHRAPSARGARRRHGAPRRAAHRSRSGAGRARGRRSSTSRAVAREVLAELGLVGWPKTSGSRGAHLWVRIEPRWPFATCAAPRSRSRARSSARAPRDRDREVVEGGAPRRVPRLQPERARSHDVQRVLGARDAGRARVDAAAVGRVPRAAIRAEFTLRTVPALLRRARRRARRDRRPRRPHRRAARARAREQAGRWRARRRPSRRRRRPSCRCITIAQAKPRPTRSPASSAGRRATPRSPRCCARGRARRHQPRASDRVVSRAHQPRRACRPSSSRPPSRPIPTTTRAASGCLRSEELRRLDRGRAGRGAADRIARPRSVRSGARCTHGCRIRGQNAVADGSVHAGSAPLPCRGRHPPGSRRDSSPRPPTPTRGGSSLLQSRTAITSP